MQQQISIQDLPYGKTFLELLVQTNPRTSKRYSNHLYPSATRDYMCLDLREGHGNLLGAYWETDSALLGVSTLLNTGEYPIAERESTLWQILNQNVPKKYYLSQKACHGILKRIRKQLPDSLMDALEEVGRIKKQE